MALTILDKYFIAQHQNGVTLTNGDIHKIGMISMYMASKMEDVFPLHSNIVAEKIAHGSMTSQQVTNEEKNFYKLLDFSTDFITHFDFFESYIAKIQY